MKKRAVIYVRVSSEKQADKVSPTTQKEDCIKLCQSKGYEMVNIYQDIERYRSGGKLVEPSGTRADRPALKKMIQDGYNGSFDVIIAWREDRLYRASRPMVEVIEMIEKKSVDIELVKETFDKNIAPVKAWAANMELKAKHDRYMMGMAGRFRDGKPGNQPAPYGYKKGANGRYEVNPDEAPWVVKLFEWYADEVSIEEIRRRFIAGGARQRKENKYSWHKAMLRRMLTAECYWIGIQKENWDGEVHEIPAPILISKG